MDHYDHWNDAVIDVSVQTPSIPWACFTAFRGSNGLEPRKRRNFGDIAGWNHLLLPGAFLELFGADYFSNFFFLCVWDSQDGSLLSKGWNIVFHGEPFFKLFLIEKKWDFWASTKMVEV